MKNKIVYRKAVPTDEIIDRRELLRIVKNDKNKILIDNEYKQKGRSVYLKKDIALLPIVKKKKLIERNLRYKGDISDIYELIASILKQ